MMLVMQHMYSLLVYFVVSEERAFGKTDGLYAALQVVVGIKTLSCNSN